MLKGYFSRLSRRRSASSTACFPSVLVASTRNSSPPQRPNGSEVRMACRSCSATSCKTSSPVLCPKLSLMALNRSRSNRITESGRSCLSARVTSSFSNWVASGGYPPGSASRSWPVSTYRRPCHVPRYNVLLSGKQGKGQRCKIALAKYTCTSRVILGNARPCTRKCIMEASPNISVARNKRRKATGPGWCSVPESSEYKQAEARA